MENQAKRRWWLLPVLLAVLAVLLWAALFLPAYQVGGAAGRF